MATLFEISDDQFDVLFPYHIVIDEDLKVISRGSGLTKLLNIERGASMLDVFNVICQDKPLQNFEDLYTAKETIYLAFRNLDRRLSVAHLQLLKQKNLLIVLTGPDESILSNNNDAANYKADSVQEIAASATVGSEHFSSLLKKIDEQEKEIQRLTLSKNQAETIAIQNPDPILRITLEGEIIEENHSAALIKNIEYENRNWTMADFCKMIAKNKEFNSEKSNLEMLSDGIDYSFIVVPLQAEGHINLYGRDITKLKKHRTNLKHFSKIIQQSLSAIIITDPQGRTEWVSKGFEKITGYSMAEAVGKKPGELLQGSETNPATVSYLREQIKNEQPFSCDIYNYHKNGSGYWLTLTGQPVYNDDGLLIHYFATEEDISFKREISEKAATTANRMSGLIENLNASILFENHDGTIGFMNKNFFKLFDIPGSPETAIGFACTSLESHSKHIFKDPQGYLDSIRHLQKENKKLLAEQLELVTGDTLLRDFIPIWTGDRLDGYLWVYRDITEKLESERKLESQRIFYEQILDNIPADIVVFNKHGQFLYLNPTAVGDPILRKSLIRKTDDEFAKLMGISDEMAQTRKDFFKQILESKQLISWEEETKETSGVKGYVMRNLFPVLSQADHVELIIQYGVDISNIKKIQQVGEKNEKSYKDLIENSLAIIITHDLKGKFIMINPMVEKTFGYSAEEIQDQFLSKYIPDEDKFLFKSSYLDVIEEQKNVKGIFRIVSKSGGIVYLLYNNYLKENPGEEPYVIAFAVDITDRILAEKELKKAKRITEELAKTKQNFLTNMSHEIRTPMNAIFGMSKQLLKTTLSEKQQLYLDTINSATENLLVIINDILDHSKLEAGKIVLEKIGFDPKFLIEKVMSLISYKAEEKNLLLTKSKSDLRLSEVLIGDPFRLNQILLNLLANAIKFTAIGSVDISCVVTEESEVSQTLMITVTDTGIGMDADFVKSLFKSFSQEDESVARRFGGTGLGMNITKSLVDLMRGEIYVESTKGEGTAISITVKFDRGNQDDLVLIDQLPADTAALRSKKVLVVDDNEMNRLVASTILSDYHVVVREAKNGVEAIALLQKEKFDLVLMDIQMPIMDGYEATRIIRKQLKSDVVVIALTANAINQEDRRCFEAGMNDFLTKPFEEKQMIQMMTNWIQNKKADGSGIIGGKIYDLSKMYELSRENDGFVQKMVGIFIDQLPPAITEMETAFEQKDFGKIAGIAHKIKPSFFNLGISSAKQPLLDIEEMSKADTDLPGLEQLILTFKNITEQSITALKADVVK